ncbi:aromatic prenyltransferase [Streptomyces xanthochromogenes]|uniref:aromatic prenyltransferase n=1 Tax=Streptomyces xanthochromogenes TaxID=67384 RepID=UPI00381E8E14
MDQTFLRDIRATATLLDAPFSETATRQVLTAYADRFADDTVIWKTTEKPDSGLVYRFYSRTQHDTLTTALRHRLIPAETDTTRFLRHLAHWRGSSATFSCDFDAHDGLAKTYVFLAATTPAEALWAEPFTPTSLTQHRQLFHTAGLTYLRFIALDHPTDNLNLYFRAAGPITEAQYTALLHLPGAQRPKPEVFRDIAAFLPQDFTVAVTLAQGRIARTGLYAPGLPQTSWPALPQRLHRFLTDAPSLDTPSTHVAAWSFGTGKGTYMKAEKSYRGDFAALLRDWTHTSRSRQTDPVLLHQGHSTS